MKFLSRKTRQAVPAGVALMLLVAAACTGGPRALGPSSTRFMAGAGAPTWNSTSESLGIGIGDPEGGIHLKDRGATPDRTSISLDSSPSPLRRRSLRYLTNGVLRWGLDVDPAVERGANEGSYFGINAYKDDGSYARTQLAMRRYDGATMWFPNDPHALMSIGASAVTPGSRLTVLGSRNALRLQISGAITGSLQTALISEAIAPGAMPAGFGVEHRFSVREKDGHEQALARVSAAINGSARDGSWSVATARSGVLETGITVTPGGRTILGGVADNGADRLQVSGDVQIHGKLYLRAETPASSSAECRAGQLAYDRFYVYVCVAANTWKRSALTSW